MMRLALDRVASPLGTMLVVWDQDGTLRALDFEDHETRCRRLLKRHYGASAVATGAAPRPIADALERFFAGEVGAIAAVAVATNGTPFQRRVWAALRAIPAGTTVSYGRLAATIGRPTASRAVGLANGANPIGIVVPCHRVVGSDGSLTGYGGGLERKRWLLAHEQRHTEARRASA